jgi:hypothetical protein
VRKILIVGAGQSGLQLALCLQAEGYDVTVMSARTPDEIRGGWPTSTQAMFWPALDREREYNLNLWENVATPIEGISAALAPAPGVQAFSFYGPWDRPGQSVDQRVKMATWLELFEERGGRTIYHSVMTSDLAGLAPLYDLTIIAAGKGEIVELFDRDASRSKYTTPGRHLAAIYLNGVAAPADLPVPRVRVNIAPGEVEVFSMPAYSHSGACDIALVEAIPGGPWDIFVDRPDPAEHLRRVRSLLLQYFPWEGELYTGAEPADARASLAGAFTTTVRHPYAEVAPGSYVLGIADVVVVLDPIAGQGANNASHAAGIYLRSILERADAPFDPEWMQRTFDAFWAQVADSVLWTEMMLEPLPEHAQQFLGAASQFPEVACTFARFFPYPSTLHDYLTDPAKTAAYLESVATAR